MSETFAVWFMQKYRAEQVDSDLLDKIRTSIPNRLAYFDNLDIDISPNKPLLTGHQEMNKQEYVNFLDHPTQNSMGRELSSVPLNLLETQEDMRVEDPWVPEASSNSNGRVISFVVFVAALGVIRYFVRKSSKKNDNDYQKQINDEEEFKAF